MCENTVVLCVNLIGPLDSVVYLQKNLSLVDSSDKRKQLESEMRLRGERRGRLPKKFDVFNNERVYAKRNPAIQGLIKDLSSAAGLGELQEELKLEFDMFLTASFKHTSESLRSVSRSGSGTGEAATASGGIFLTEDNGECRV